jgi:hypothetical protein
MKMDLAAVVGALLVLCGGHVLAQDEVAPDVEAAYSSAQIAIAERDCAGAVRHLRQVLAVHPDRWEAHRDSASCFMKLDVPHEALLHYREWLRIRPGEEMAAAGVTAAETRARILEQHRETRQREREAALRRRPEPPALADVAREHGRSRPVPDVPVYVLNGIGQPVKESAPAVPHEAPVFLLDSMRHRAEEVLRPRMEAVAPEARQLALAQTRYAQACVGRTTTKVIDGIREGQSVEFTSRGRRRGPEPAVKERAWVERYQATETTANEETVDCRSLSASIDVLASRVGTALAGTEARLASPAVYPGIRDEVYARLQAELW